MPSSADPDETERPVTATALRASWEDGRHGSAIRAVLEHWDRVVRGAEDPHWLVQPLRACGLTVEAFAVQHESTRRQGRRAAWEGLIRSVLGTGDPWWARELLTEAGGDSRELRALRIEVELAIGDPAPLIEAWVRDYADEAARETAVRWWIRCHRVEEAERLVDGAEGLALWRARFALWRNQPDVARRVLATLPADPQSRCLEAIALVLDGQLEEGETKFRALLDTEARADAWTWLATVLRKQRRYADAIKAADAASSLSTDFNLVARLERELAADLEMMDPPQVPDATWRQRIAAVASRLLRPLRLRRIGELENATALYPLGLRPRDSIGVLDQALARFGGNHTVHLSTVDGGVLRSYPLPENPRQLGSVVQSVLWTRGADATRALYDMLAPRIDDHPLFRIYHGEVELWMGEYETAERIFRAILARDDRTRWAWIGLGASVMLQGDYSQAQRIWTKGLSKTHGVPGPTLYVYRGECYRRQGEIARARAELETGLRQKPQRLSARINLALLDHDPAALARVEQECTAVAPLLMAELTGSPAERLEQVLVAMRGNRSSSEWHVSYHLWGRLWRRGTLAAAGT